MTFDLVLLPLPPLLSSFEFDGCLFSFLRCLILFYLRLFLIQVDASSPHPPTFTRFPSKVFGFFEFFLDIHTIFPANPQHLILSSSVIVSHYCRLPHRHRHLPRVQLFAYLFLDLDDSLFLFLFLFHVAD